MKTTRGYVLLAGALLYLPATSLTAGEPASDLMETEFVDGGKITIELSAGEHQISESGDNTIRVYWRVGDEHDLDVVDAVTEVDGSTAEIELDGPRNNFETLIKVPRNSDLTIKLSAGELSVDGVVGSKDVHLRAGELSIEVGDTDDYAHVEGSLWAGDIDAGPFDEAKSGLFRSIEWHGDGQHELKFKLYAGDVRLYTREAEN